MESAGNWVELKNALHKGKVLLPGDDGFEERLARWSATCVKPAVSLA
jgi:hypothetical protein